MALTLRIEENPDAAAALEKVKELFGETSATKAIYAALEYATLKEKHQKDIKNLKDMYNVEKNRADRTQDVIADFSVALHKLIRNNDGII